MSMTLRDIAVLIQIEQAASPGPWSVKRGHRGEPQLHTGDGSTLGSKEQADANTAFIVAARTAVPELLKMLAERDAYIRALMEAVR